MGQEIRLYCQPGVLPLSDRLAEMGGIPVNDDGGKQVDPGHAVALAFAGGVADFTPAPDAERVLECVMSLALVQDGVRPALSVRGRARRQPGLACMMFSLIHFCPRAYTAQRQGRRAKNAGPGQRHPASRWLETVLFTAMAGNHPSP